MINLLPPKQKEALLNEQKYKLFLISGFLAIIFLVALALSLLTVRIYISGQVSQAGVTIPDQLQSSQKKIVDINKSLERLNFFYADQPDFARILDEISLIMPAGLEISSITVDFDQELEKFPVSLRGFSPTRELLSQLKKNLESKEIFSDVNFPASNWIKPEEVRFDISFKIGL